MRRLVGAMAGEMLQLLRSLWGLALVALFAELGYAVMLTGALPLYLPAPPPHGIGASYSLTGAIISAFLVSEAIFRAPLGWWADRIGRKAFITGGLVISAVTPLIMHQVTHPVLFFPLRILDGLGSAAIWPCVFTTVASLTAGERRTAAMSVFTMTYIAGVVLGLPLYSLFVSLASHPVEVVVQGKVYRTVAHPEDVFYIIAALFAVAALVSLFFVPQTYSQPARLEISGHEEEVPAVPGETLGLRQALHLALLDPVLKPMMLTVFIQTLGLNLLTGPFVWFVKAQLHLAESEIGKALIGPGIAVAVLALPLGWLGGRWGKVKSVQAGLGVAAVAMWLMPHVYSLAVLTLIAIPLMAGFLMALPAWQALITEIAPPGQQGLVVGAMATAQGIGAMAGPTVGSLLYDAFGRHLPFYGAAALFTVAFIMSLKYFREGSRIHLEGRS